MLLSLLWIIRQRRNTRSRKKEDPKVVEKKKETAKKTAQKFSKATEIDVKPMSPEEMKELIAKTKEGEGDDCLMCGS